MAGAGPKSSRWERATRRASLASFEKLAEDDFQELQRATRARAEVFQVTAQ